MAVKIEDFKSANVMEVFLNGWLSQLNVIEEIENKSLQIIKSQKEWIEGTMEQFLQMEEDSKKLTSEWKANVLDLIVKNQIELGNERVAELLRKLEDIGHKSQSIAFLPGKASFDILLNSREQFEKSYAEAFDQQKKNREELSKIYEEISEQLKQSQAGLLKPFELVK